MAKKKPIVSPLGQWAYPGEVTIIPSSNITMKGVNYPVLGVDDLGNSQMMMPGQDYTFAGDYVTEIPQMGKGGLAQWFAEEWTDVKTGKPCGRSGKEKGSRPYPACRPKKRVNETTPKTTSEMSSAEKAKFKREKTSGKRIDYNHKRREDGGETWLDQYQTGGPFLEDIKDPIVIPTPIPQTQKTSFWDLMSYQKDPNNPDNYIKVNKNPNYYKFNTKLNNEGSPEIQAYQNYLNENFNTFIKEDGVWNDETKKAYEKYVVNSQNSEDLNKNKSIKLNTKQPLEFRYENGALQVKATNPKYNPDLEDWTDLKKLNPTLEEFKAIIDNVPSYNKYYENIYDVNNTIRGVQAGPLDKERQSEISAAKRYQELDPKYKEYLGKTFGNLPIVEKEGIYEGYSPSRIWTTPPGSNSKPWLGDDEVYNPNTDLRYLYFVKPKEGSVWADEKYKKELENLNCINGNCGDEYLNKGNSAFSAPTLNLSKKKTEKVLPFPTGDTWKLGQQSYAEMISNPEILKYAKEKGIDLTDLGKDQYSPILAEAIIGRRDAEFNNKGVVIPHSREYVPVIQDPNQFDLAGYLPITLDMFSPNMNPDAKNQALLNWDEKSKAEYFRRAGIPEDQWDKVYIHTSPFPINNYTPGKKYGGWLEKYQTGGSFTNLLKLALTPEVRGIVANQLVDKGVTKVAQKVGDASKQQIFDRYRPIDYPDPIGAIVNSGKDIPLRDLQGDYHVSEEAWRLALGLPTKSKYISPSKYRPTKASDPNAQYYSLNNVYDPQKLIDAYIQKAQGKPGQTVQMDALSPYIINQDMMTTDNEIPFTQTDPLQKFSLSQGEDERGRYISIYDKYDFNVPYMDAVVYGSNRKPYEFYDRFYYKKDAAGKPVYVKQKKQGGQTDWLNKYK